MTIPRRSLAFALVACVVGAHTLRNVSTVGYLGLYGLTALWAGVAFLRSDWRARLLDRGATLAVWIGILLWGAIVTYSISGVRPAVEGLSRFVFPLPILLALVAWTRTRADLLRHVAILVGLFAALAMTLPLQFLTGPIPFFAAPSMRGGEVRYASAIGSLTSIGIIVGCYLVLAQLLRPRWRWPAMLLITLPAIASLSKAALANVLVAFALVLWLNRRNRTVFLGAVVGLPLAAAASYLAVPAIRNRVDTTLLSFGVRTDKVSVVDDVTLGASMVERLALLPAQNWDGLARIGNDVVYAVGGGFGMGDTALVSEADGLVIMAHNQLFESLTVFGLVGGLLQWGVLVLLLALTVRRHRLTRDPLYGVMALVSGLFLVNSFLANGTLYQPLAGAVLYLLMFVALGRLDDPTPAVPTPPKETPWSSRA